MLKACKYCGKIHAKDFICDKKPVTQHIHNRDIDRFRDTQLWKNKRTDIKKRDKYICQACYHNLYGTTQRINADNLSVHHIIPIKSNWELRLNDDNLITLCGYHHELAEKGTIKASQFKEIVKHNTI